jgi:hypothetical protein
MSWDVQVRKAKDGIKEAILNELNALEKEIGDAISRSGDLEQFKKDIFTTQVQTEKWFLRALITRLLLQEITQKINL